MTECFPLTERHRRAKCVASLTWPWSACVGPWPRAERSARPCLWTCSSSGSALGSALLETAPVGKSLCEKVQEACVYQICGTSRQDSHQLGSRPGTLLLRPCWCLPLSITSCPSLSPSLAGKKPELYFLQRDLRNRSSSFSVGAFSISKLS